MNRTITSRTTHETIGRTNGYADLIARMNVNVSDDRIAALRSEAAEAGDDMQVAICDQAIAGNKRAVYLCALALRDAAAQVSS